MVLYCNIFFINKKKKKKKEGEGYSGGIKEIYNSFEDYEGSESLTEPSKASQRNNNNPLQQERDSEINPDTINNEEEEEKSLSEDPFPTGGLYQNASIPIHSPRDQMVVTEGPKPEKENLSTDVSSLDDGNFMFDRLHQRDRMPLMIPSK